MQESELQEQAFFWYAARNKWILRKDLRRSVGRQINGIEITESGILAAAHLAGPGNVKKFFRKGYEFHDGNGTKMTEYLVKFSGYKLVL